MLNKCRKNTIIPAATSRSFWGGAHYAKPCCSRHMAHCFRRAAPSFLPGKYESIFKSFCIEWKHKKHTGFEYDFFYIDHGKTSFGDFGAHLIVHCTSELFLTCYIQLLLILGDKLTAIEPDDWAWCWYLPSSFEPSLNSIPWCLPSLFHSQYWISLDSFLQRLTLEAINPEGKMLRCTLYNPFFIL